MCSRRTLNERHVPMAMLMTYEQIQKALEPSEPVWPSGKALGW